LAAGVEVIASRHPVRKGYVYVYRSCTQGISLTLTFIHFNLI